MINIGTVMEIEKNQALVVTVDFDMVYVRKKPGMFIGQQVSFQKSDLVNRKGLAAKYGPIAAGFAAVFILSLFLYFKFLTPGTDSRIYAYIDVDINPSIEFAINADNKVLNVKAINEDAELILDDEEMENMKIDQAVAAAIKKAKDFGFITGEKRQDILLSGCLNIENSGTKESKEKDEKKLETLLSSIKKNKDFTVIKDIHVDVIKVNPELKKLADTNEISLGRQVIFNIAKEKGITLSLEEVKNKSISEVMEMIQLKESNAPSPTPQKEKATPSTKPAVTPIPSPAPKTSPKAPVPATPTPYDKVTYDNTEPVKPPTSGSGRIKIQYYNAPETVGDAIQINAEFRVVNTGDTAIDLRNVKFRYYYTIDGEKQQFFDCWAHVGNQNITGRFVKMAKLASKADYYLEIGFKTGILLPGENTIVNTWFNKEEWAKYKQDNDYSYNPKVVKDYYDWNKVTGYISGVLKWGVEPSGAPAKQAASTDTKSYAPIVTGGVENGKIKLRWQPASGEGFNYYKIVASKSNANPKYPEDGYLYFITDRNKTEAVIDSTMAYNSGDFGGYLIPGEKYYFSVTTVYHSGAAGGNALYLTVPK
ncbi:MAG: anti-sigma factor domain-containing protein [Clostridia bacterium]|nr:anti-sigma factor domain-containing protein [Clostridia bacterium]